MSGGTSALLYEHSVKSNGTSIRSNYSSAWLYGTTVLSDESSALSGGSGRAAGGLEGNDEPALAFMCMLLAGGLPVTGWMLILVLMLVLVACMLAGVEAGRFAGRLFIRRHGKEALSSYSTVEGATLALFGLIVAFSFSGAVGRFDSRRDLLIDQTNAVGTAWLRIDLLPQDDQPRMRELMREYVDTLLAAGRLGREGDEMNALLARLDRAQADIWTLAVTSAGRDEKAPPTMLLLPALNEMFDLSTSRLAMGTFHTPGLVLFALFAMAALAAMAVGSSMAKAERRSPLHELGFIFVVSLAIMVLLDIEYSRAGFVKIDASDRFLVSLRASMDEPRALKVLPEAVMGSLPATRPAEGD